VTLHFVEVAVRADVRAEGHVQVQRTGWRKHVLRVRRCNVHHPKVANASYKP
jgi:hypothetical protein